MTTQPRVSSINARIGLPISQRSERLIVVLIVAAFVALAVGFSLGPILEGADEFPHYQLIHVLIQNRALPDASLQPVGGQYHQAPLYYVMSIPLVKLAGDTDFLWASWDTNPFFGYQFTALGNDNKNVLMHPRSEAFPYTGSPRALAFHLVRLFSVLLGTGTLITSYFVFAILWPERYDRRLIALGLVAFWPQFIYLSSTVNNDNLLILLSTVGLLVVLRQMRDGPSWGGAVLLGILLGLALLAKASALVLGVPVGFAVLSDIRRWWRHAAVILGIVLLVSGWWYARNIVLYHDPIGVGNILAQWGAKIDPSEGLTLARLPRIHSTLWALFGLEVIRVAPEIYALFDGLAILALAGAIVGGVRSAQNRLSQWFVGSFRRDIAIVTVYALIWVVQLIYLTATAESGNRGRYLLPGIASWGALFAYGLDTFTPRRLRLSLALSTVIVLATGAAISLFGYFLPAYRPSPLPNSINHPLSLRYEDAAELIGVKQDFIHARPGERIYITLYWRAIQPTDVSLTSFVHSVGSNVVFRDSLPATGNLLSTDWLPGQTWTEEYLVGIPQDTEDQVVYSLMAGLYETDTERALAVTDSDGREVMPFVGQIVINGPAQPFDPEYRFGDSIGLAEPTVSLEGETLKVCLRWVSLAPVSVDYHIFTHVLSDAGVLIAQTDFQPKAGRYPTRAWSIGEAVDDCVSLTASQLSQRPRSWRVAVGLYELESGKRLPVVDRDGHLLDNGMVVIALR